MKPLTIQGIVLVLLLAALPLASAGTTTDTAWLSIAALVVFGLAALTPPVLRFVGPDDGDDDGADGHGSSEQDGEHEQAPAKEER